MDQDLGFFIIMQLSGQNISYGRLRGVREGGREGGREEKTAKKVCTYAEKE